MKRELSRLLAPKSVAVVGGGTWCTNAVHALARFGFGGPVFRVHPTRDRIDGIATYPSVRDLPIAPDAAFIGVNHAATLEVVADLRAKGAGGAVAFASGFGEVDGGVTREAALRAAAGEMPVLGPNCYGFVNALDRVALWPDVHGCQPVDRGVAVVTQSSNLAINLTMQRRALPIAMVVTAGNQAQIGLAEVGRALVADRRITALGLHIEGIGDLRAFEALAVAAHRAGTPVVVLKTGRSREAQAAAVSHTASLAGSHAGASALFRRLGCAEAEGVEDFLETLKLLHVGGPLKGHAIASMSCSGGEASLMADAAHRVGGVAWHRLSGTQTHALSQALGPKVAIANPLDYHTYIWNDVPAMTRAYAAMLRGDQALTCIVADFPLADRADPADWMCIVDAAKAAVAETGGRLALLSTLPETMPEETAQDLHATGIATLCGMEDGLRAIRAAGGIGVPEAAPVVWTEPPTDVALLAEAEAKAWLAGYSVPVPRGVSATRADAAHAAQNLHPPLVAKGQGLAHKSEAGAVRLGLSIPDLSRTAAELPGTHVLIEEQVTDGLAELLVGVVRDPAHGFVLTLGAGGTLTELWQDTASLLVPASRASVDAALASLRIAPLLDGWRGSPPVARAALLDAVMAVQDAVIAEAATLEEVEINPLIVTHTRAVAVDALVRKGTPA
ncbi:acetate--CoA ligase family protein [Pseudaestuariivita sp.]|uniref:acetate--CoA ligase family protein n=1 Tax=Pseudaestuariivita sp. TaxID=2211669 RepID=UPI004057D322